MADSQSTEISASLFYKYIDTNTGYTPVNVGKRDKDGKIPAENSVWVYPPQDSPNGLSVLPQRHQLWSLSPQTFSSGVPVGTSPVIFRLIRDYISSKIEEMYLVWTITNNTGSTVTPTIASMMISNNGIQIGLNASNTSQNTISPLQLYFQNQYFPKSKMNELLAFNSQNMNDRFSQPTALVNGASMTLTLPLPSCVCNDVNTTSLSGDILIQIYFNSSNTEVGSACIVANPLVLFVSERNDYIDRPITKLLTEPNALPQILNYVDVQTYQINCTLTAGVLSLISLNTINGFACSVWFAFNASTINASGGARSFTSLGDPNNVNDEYNATIDIVDSTKRSIFGSGNSSCAYIRGMNQSAYTPGDFSRYIPVYGFHFAHDPVEAYNTGRFVGSYQFNGQQNLQITPSASSGLSSTSLTMTATFLVYASQRLYKGYFDRQL